MNLLLFGFKKKNILVKKRKKLFSPKLSQRYVIERGLRSHLVQSPLANKYRGFHLGLDSCNARRVNARTLGSRGNSINRHLKQTQAFLKL